MDPGFRSPLLDFFRRGEVADDVRLLAAQGALAPRADEQLALLMLLSDDADAIVAEAANTTIDRLPEDAVREFLARTDVPAPMREFFVSRYGGSGKGVATGGDGALSDVFNDQSPHSGEPEPPAEEGAEEPAGLLSALPIVQRMKLAMMGTRSQRAQLIRDPNRLVAAAVLSSPKLSEAEIEAFAKIATLSEEILRAIAMNKAWLKNYGVVVALTRNPKTPPAISLHLMQRLNDRDMRALSMDRNVPEPVRVSARRHVVKGER